MTSYTVNDWARVNRQHLQASLDAVRGALSEEAGAPVTLPEPPPAVAPPVRLTDLSALFGLGYFETITVLLAAGVELDPAFAQAVASAPGSVQGAPTFQIAMGLAGEGAWSALCPQAPLRRWRLVEPQGSGPLAHRPLKIDERVLHHLLGVDYLDVRLDGLVEPVNVAASPTQRRAVLADRVAEIWAARRDSAWSAIQIVSPDRVGVRSVVLAAAAGAGFRVFRLDVADIPADGAERQALARFCDRESAFSGGVLLVECESANGDEPRQRLAAELVDAIAGPVIVSAVDPLPLQRDPRVRLDLPAPDRGERRELWREMLGDRAAALGEGLEQLAEQFSLDGAGIRAAIEATGDADHFDRLWDACRLQARRRLDALAERVESGATWDDIVLPLDRLEQIKDIALHVRLGHRVYEDWGWEAKSTRGLGVAALFAGASGTGKTLAAEILANELRLDLYRIDLSQVVSKYIGETEKNLSRIFEAAETSGAILLFDEADALFGKRSEVKDSHDRYANVEVSYLLQRMEAYRGLAILTTNQKSALDPAFLRRLRFVVDFPFPDAALRAGIWGRIFPSATPINGLDISRLARLTVAGGNIRSIAINAAFLAASDGGAVTTSHVMTAARREYGKLEKALTSAEFGDRR